jgi:hypothetical protein
MFQRITHRKKTGGEKEQQEKLAKGGDKEKRDKK